MTTVYCTGCGEPLRRKRSEVERNRSGTFYCETCKGIQRRQNGMMPQQRGYRRSVPA